VKSRSQIPGQLQAPKADNRSGNMTEPPEVCNQRLAGFQRACRVPPGETTADGNSRWWELGNANRSLGERPPTVTLPPDHQDAIR